MIPPAALALALMSQGHLAHAPQRAPAQVFVVSPSGGLPDIQTAVDLAGDGDTVLVKSGTYPGFSIVDKGIFVTVDSGSTVVVQGSVIVQDLAAGKSALLAGLTVDGSSSGPALVANDNAGGIRIEGCYLAGADFTGGSNPTPGRPGASFANDADLALVMCTLAGGRGLPSTNPVSNGGPGGVGLVSSSSSIALQECVLVGGDAGQGAMDQSIGGGSDGGVGGSGLQVTDGFLYTSGSDIQGGTGGAGGDHLDTLCLFYGGPGNGGQGGSGIQVTSAAASPAVVLFGTSIEPGPGGRGGSDHSQHSGGYPCWGDGQPGSNGAQIAAPPGAVDSLPGATRRLTGARVVREGATATVRAYGEPGDIVQILAGGETEFVYAPTYSGVQLLNLGTSVVVGTGTIPSSGALAIEIPFAAIPNDSRPFFLQAYFRDPANEQFAATQWTLVELGSRY